MQGNDLMLPKGNVSKRHARLIFRDSRFIVTDLNSTNGTYVNRRRISQATIVREGDRIYIGDFVLRIEMPDGASEPSTGGEQTGSGPVPAAVRAAASESGATAFPDNESEEPSGAYPEVPGPPRMPSAPRPEAPSAAHPSYKIPPASVVDAPHADVRPTHVAGDAADLPAGRQAEAGRQALLRHPEAQRQRPTARLDAEVVAHPLVRAGQGGGGDHRRGRADRDAEGSADPLQGTVGDADAHRPRADHRRGAVK